MKEEYVLPYYNFMCQFCFLIFIKFYLKISLLKNNLHYKYKVVNCENSTYWVIWTSMKDFMHIYLQIKCNKSYNT